MERPERQSQKQKQIPRRVAARDDRALGLWRFPSCLRACGRQQERKTKNEKPQPSRKTFRMGHP